MATASLSQSSEFSDVNNEGYVSGPVSVTSTAVEAKVNLNKLSGREWISIHNKGPKRVYYGPSGITSTTGEPLEKDQYVCLPFGENIAIFVLCATGDTATVVVQEGA